MIGEWQESAWRVVGEFWENGGRVRGDWFESGTRVVRKWYESGTRVVREWHGSGKRVVREGFGRRFGCQYFGELGFWTHDFAQRGQKNSDRLRGLGVGYAKGDNSK